MWDTRGGTRARGAEPHDDHREEQHKRLLRGAVLLAVVESILTLVLLNRGFRPPTILFGALVLTLPWILPFVNVLTVEAVYRGAPPATMPKWRPVVGVVTAAVVACMVVGWVFSGAVAVAMTSSEDPGWRAAILKLEEDRTVKLKVVERGMPNVDQDPEVQRLRLQLAKAEEEFWEAWRNELCEADGTCGTKVRGKGTEYYQKVDYRVGRGHEITRLTAAIESAKAAAGGRADRSSEDSRKAKSELDRIDAELERLRSSPPQQRSRTSALLWVVQEKSDPVVLVWVGALITFLLLDLLVLRAVVRQVYRRDDGRESREQKFALQREIDKRRDLGAKPYPDEGGE